MAIGNLNPPTSEKFVEKLEASLEKKEDKVSELSPTPQRSRPTETMTKTQVTERSFHRTTERPKVKTTKRAFHRMIERPNDRTVKVSKGRTTILPGEVRRKVRHSFDIFEDQVLPLKEIQLARQRESGNKCLLGDLVQEALDMFIAEEHVQD